jgi:hypothetical protein
MGSRANPIVTRFYREPSEAESCAQAVRLLLDVTKRKQMATGPGGHDDAEESKNDRTDTASIQR